MTIKVAAYIKSYPRPWEPQGMRPEEQRARVEQYIAEQGWDLVAVLDDSGPEVAGSRRLVPQREGAALQPPLPVNLGAE